MQRMTSDAPLLRVLRGEPTAEELAALVTVLAARAASTPATGHAAPRSAWADPARALRRPVTVGPDGWRASARPR